MHYPKSSHLDISELRRCVDRLREGLADLQAYNANCRDFLKKAARLSAAGKAANVRLLDKAASSRRLAGAVKAKPPIARCSTLFEAYLQFKIIEALQPHPAYDNDDGFQPLGVILALNFKGDRKAKKARTQLEAAGLSLLDVLGSLEKRGIVVRTGYEPQNGDVMVGLTENLPKREAADCERRSIVSNLAHKYGLHPRWYEDGTGSLETPSGDIVQPAGCIWTLLSSLYEINESVSKRPSNLN